MKLSKTNNKIKIICATSAVLFSLITCFTAVFAWFMVKASANDSTNEFGIIADPNVMNFDFYLYKYDADSKKGYRIKENASGFTLDLNQYDNFIKERNENNNNILRFEIDFSTTYSQESYKRKINFTVNSGVSKSGDPFDNGLKDGKNRRYSDDHGYRYTSDGNPYICNNISNVVYFKVLPYTYVVDGITYKYDPSVEIDETDVSNTYFDVTEEFLNRDPIMFVNSDNKINDITFSIPGVNGLVTSMVVYVEYSYDLTLINSFLKPNEFVKSSETAEIFTGGVNINFFKDIHLIKLESESEVS